MSTKSTTAKPALKVGNKKSGYTKSSATSSQRKRASAPVVEPKGSKQSRLISLLQTSEGCTISQMTDLTGWQAHTVRGVISGVLRKRLGLDVVCEKTADGSSYKIAATAR